MYCRFIFLSPNQTLVVRFGQKTTYSLVEKSPAHKEFPAETGAEAEPNMDTQDEFSLRMSIPSLKLALRLLAFDAGVGLNFGDVL
jgi:hypothetical protein